MEFQVVIMDNDNHNSISSKSGNGNRKMAAIPVSCWSCSPETCITEKTNTSPPPAFTDSTRSTYFRRVGISALLKSSSVMSRV